MKTRAAVLKRMFGCPCKRKRKGRREGEVLASILSYLAMRGDCFFWRANSGVFNPGPGRFVRTGAKGMGDIIGCLSPSGRMFSIEVKREIGGRVSPAQKAFAKTLVEHGGIAIIARSVQDVINILPQGPVLPGRVG